MIRDALPPALYAHTSQQIDFDRLAGKRVVILGAGAGRRHSTTPRSRWSRAPPRSTCSIAASISRGSIPTAGSRTPAFLRISPTCRTHGNGGSSAACRTTTSRRRRNSFDRCVCQHNFIFHPGEPWTEVAQVGDRVRVTTPKATYDADFAIIGTGLIYDLKYRPEIAPYADKIATWADRLPEAARDPDPSLRNTPYLGPHYEYVEKVPGTLDWAGKVLQLYVRRDPEQRGDGLASERAEIRHSASRAWHRPGLFLESVDIMFESFANYSDPLEPVPVPMSTEAFEVRP